MHWWLVFESSVSAENGTGVQAMSVMWETGMAAVVCLTGQRGIDHG